MSIIFDEAIDKLLNVGAIFIATPCNPIGEENSDSSHLRDLHEDIEPVFYEVTNTLKLGKLEREARLLLVQVMNNNKEAKQLYLDKLYEIEVIENE